MLFNKDLVLISQKVAAAYDTHRNCARAAGRCVFYRLEDVYDLVQHQLAQHECPYCRGLLKARDFVIGHKVPIFRGGRYCARNLTVMCQECAVLRGALDDHEFRDLLRLLSDWPTPLQDVFRKQLRAGASLTRTAAALGDSAEWRERLHVRDEDSPGPNEPEDSPHVVSRR